MPNSRPKAPPGTYWRANTLWGRTRHKGHEIRWSLETDNPKIAAQRRKAGVDRVIALRRGDANPPYAQVLEEWTNWIAKEVGPATAERYGCSLDQLAPWFRNKTIGDIDKKLVATIIIDRQKTVSNATIRRDLTALSSLMEFAKFKDYRDDNPVLEKRDAVTEKRDPIVLPENEHIKLAIERAPGMMGHLIEAAAYTGARQGELLRAQRNHIVDASMTLIGKGNKLRVIDLAPFGGHQFLTSLPAASAVPDRYLFWHGDGKPYGASFKGNFRKFMVATEAWAKANGVDFRPFRFHDLRHWHAVHYLKAGVGDIYALQKRLGHTSVTVTESYLKYLTPDEERRAKYHGTKSGTSAPVFVPTDTNKVLEPSI